MSNDTLRTALLALAVAATIATAFFACFERRIERMPTGYSREAMRNPYLAYERLLERMGHEVVSLEGPGGLDPLPPSYATIVLPTERRTLSAERTQALIDWVHAGGALVVVSHSLWDTPGRRPDPVLDPLGIRQFENELEPEGDESSGDPEHDVGEDPVDEDDDEPDLDLTGIFADAAPERWDECSVRRDDGRVLEMRFDARWSFGDEQGRVEHAVGGPYGMHLAIVPLGAGFVVALTDDYFLRNAFIGDLDHAEVALLTAKTGGRSGPVWIVVHEEFPGLLARAWQVAPVAVLLAAFWLVAWVWRASRRFGPILPESEPVRRRFLEHLDAVGRFHLRRGDPGRLLSGARAALASTLRARHPGWARLDATTVTRRLAEASGLPEPTVAEALATSPSPGGAQRVGRDAASFVTTIRNLERIRRSL